VGGPSGIDPPHNHWFASTKSCPVGEPPSDSLGGPGLTTQVSLTLPVNVVPAIAVHLQIGGGTLIVTRRERLRLQRSPGRRVSARGRRTGGVTMFGAES